jgi:hypothetical protein
MPRVSEKQQLVNQNQILFMLIIDDDQRNKKEIDELFDLKSLILSFRYFRSQTVIPKSLEHKTMLLILKGKEFKEAFRMKKP